MPMNPNNPANIYAPTGAATARAVPDKAPDFGDFLNAAAEKQQDRLPENRPPEKVKRVYSMSPGQKKSLRKKYGNARFSRFEIVIDRDRIYCSDPVLTEFTRKLWEMGMLTPEEAELGAGKRPLPRDVFTARRHEKDDENGSALISAGNDYLYDNSGWIDLLYPRKLPENVGDYFAHQEIVLNTLRIYLSNPTAAISLWGEYFAFDPFQIKECLAAVQKISSLWADTAMKDKGALYSKKRTFYRERSAGENIGNIIDTKLPVRGDPEPYGNAPRGGRGPEMPGRNAADMRREVPGENASEKSAYPIDPDVRNRPGRDISRESAPQGEREVRNKPYRNISNENVPQKGGNSPKAASQGRAASSDSANSFEQISWDENDAVDNSFEEISWDDTPKGKASNSGSSSASKPGAGSFGSVPQRSGSAGHISQTPVSRNTAGSGNAPYKNSPGSNYTAGASANAPRGSVNSYEMPSENSDAFREVSLDEAAGKESAASTGNAGTGNASNAPANNVPFKEIPRDPIVHHGAAGRAKAYREIPGERSGRIEPTPEPYREPAQREKTGHSQNPGHSPKELLKTPRKEASGGKQEKPVLKEAGTVAAYQEMIRERNARRKGEK